MSDKWKDHLLKSSLPLEQLVAEKLIKKNLQIAGEYPYIRPNEQNINTEFSVDLHAYATYAKGGVTSTRLNYLIECKYNYPGVKWVFTPHTNGLGNPLFSYTISHEENEILFHLWELSRYIPFYIPICTRGIELHNNGFDPNIIFHGLNQLLYGMPNLIFQEANIVKHRSYRVNIGVDESIIYLILVTTADLFVLKTNQSLEIYHTAKSLDDIAEKVDVLLVEQELGPNLQQYCEWLLAPTIPSSIETDFRGMKKLILRELVPEVFQVIVVNFDKLDDILSLTSESFGYPISPMIKQIVRPKKD